MLVCLMGYIAFFAVSLGATIWVVISEVFPNSVRAKGQVLGSMTHWVWSALLSWFFPRLPFGRRHLYLRIFRTYCPRQPYLCDKAPRDQGQIARTDTERLVK